MRRRPAGVKWAVIPVSVLFVCSMASPVFACSGMSGGGHEHSSTAEAAGATHQADHPGTQTPLTNTPAAGHTEGSSQGVWACPMHPEVRASFQTRCPRCGMDLEKVEVPSGRTTGR